MENQPSQPQNLSQQPQYFQCPRCGAYNYPGVPQCHYCQLPFYQQPPQYQPQQYYQQPVQQPEVKPKKQRNAFSTTFMGCFGAFAFLVVLIIFIIWLISSGSEDNKASVTAPQSVTTSSETTQSTPTTYNVGDIIALHDQTITLNEAKSAGGLLKVNFTIENISSSDMPLISLLLFEVKNSDGEILEQELGGCGNVTDFSGILSFNGTLSAGDKVKGDLCYKEKGSMPYRISYSPNILSSNKIVWLVK